MTLRKSAFVAAVVASVANIALLLVGKPYAPAPETFGPFHVMPVVMWTVVGTIGATLTYKFLHRISANGNRVFLFVAAVTLLLSFIPDYMLKDMPAGGLFGGASMHAIYLLMLMHVVAAGIITWFLLQTRTTVTE